MPSGIRIRVLTGINKGRIWVTGVGNHGCWLGTYEIDKQAITEKIATQRKVVWDVGANAGFYTVAFSRLVAPGGHVYSFEPLAENVSNLLRHIALNQAGNVSVIQGAIARHTGVIGFNVSGHDSTGAIDRSRTQYLVQAWSVDDFIAKHPESTPEVMKIDVEGAEVDLLEGSAKLLSGKGPQIILAIHSHDLWRRCFAILTSHGYTLESFSGERHKAPTTIQDEVVAWKR